MGGGIVKIIFRQFSRIVQFSIVQCVARHASSAVAPLRQAHIVPRTESNWDAAAIALLSTRVLLLLVLHLPRLSFAALVLLVCHQRSAAAVSIQLMSQVFKISVSNCPGVKMAMFMYYWCEIAPPPPPKGVPNPVDSLVYQDLTLNCPGVKLSFFTLMVSKGHWW